ncbi:MAG TPA: ABC transporter substrate-binding protein [Chloroflexota bacterium]|nr:ABC transporter substrate-binding protein [Chloroflexota bacterium]
MLTPHWALKIAWTPVLIIGMALAVACSSSATPPAKPAEKAEPAAKAAATSAPAVPAKDAAAPAAPSVNRVVIALPAPSGLESNEIRHLGQTIAWQLRPMYEYLVGVDAKTGNLVPQLATEWTAENGGRDIRFKLRQGVQFHKGNGEFTAKDVIFSWQDVAKEDSQHGESPYWRGIVKDIEAVNDYEVVFHLNRVDGNFFRAVGEAEYGMEIRSKAHADKMGAPTMESEPYAGTGPYQFKQRQQSQFILFERVPYQHWRATPAFPEFEFRLRQEASTRLAALMAGEAQMAVLPEDQLQDAVGKGMKVIKGQTPGLRTFMSFQCCFLNDIKDPGQGYKFPNSPLADVKVRQAINKSVNRDELNKAFFAGKAETMILNHFHPTRSGWNPEWEKRFPDEYGYDPAKARALLAEVGKPISTNVHIANLPQFAGADDVSEAIAGYMEKVGITVERVQMDAAQRAARQRERGFDNHLLIGGTSSFIFIGATAYSTSRGPRGAAVEDPVVDGLLDKARATLDDKEQDAILRQMGDAMFDRQMHVPLFWLPAEIVVNPKVVGEWVFPGSITGTWTHVENIKPSAS